MVILSNFTLSLASITLAITQLQIVSDNDSQCPGS